MSKLSDLIDNAISLDREIEEKTAKLKELKEKIVTQATAREDEQVPGEGGGMVWTATGSDGAMARVSFPVPALASKLDPEKKSFPKIKELAGRAFDRLFRPSITYSLAENFRDAVTAELDGKDARSLLKLVTTQSKPRVSFETKAKDPV